MAIYKKGILKPLQPLKLPDEQVVKIIVLESDLPAGLITKVAEQSGSYDFLAEAEEDVYTSQDGEKIA